MDKDKILRRIKECETSRDILLHQLADLIDKIDKYKEMLEHNSITKIEDR